MHSTATHVKTFKYRLQPSGSQRTKLVQTLEMCCWVYNETLATRKNAWEKEKKSISIHRKSGVVTTKRFVGS